MCVCVYAGGGGGGGGEEGGGKKKGGAPLTQEPTNKATVKLPKSPCSPSSIHSPGHTCQLQ